MSSRFKGHIISLYVKNCVDVQALVLYKPSRFDKYHSEIHGSEAAALLSRSQRRHLAENAIILTKRPLY